MELVERYLQAVKFALPKAQRDDVLRELSDEILSQVEEKEAALGRPLTEDEQVAMLKQIGHPALVAVRYRKQQYLIGPMVFPIYWIVLKWTLVAVVFAMSLGAVTLTITGAGLGAALGTLARIPLAVITAFAAVTCACALLDYFQAKFDFFSKWDVRTLPKLSGKQKTPSTAETIAALIFTAFFGVWWLVGLKHQFLIFGPAVAYLRFGPVWQMLYPLFAVAIVVDLIRKTLALLRPAWDKATVWFDVFFRMMNLAVLYFLYNAADLIVVGDAVNPDLQPVLKGINHVAHLCILVAAVMTVAQSAWDVYRYFRRNGKDGRQALVSL
jgi:intracellular septation protein A